jgi:hypothetical protein
MQNMKAQRNTFQIINDEGVFSQTIKSHLNCVSKGNDQNAICQSKHILEKMAMGPGCADNEQAAYLLKTFFPDHK